MARNPGKAQTQMRRGRSATSEALLCEQEACSPPVPDDGALPTREKADEELASLARAIAHPARLRILRLLAERDTCVCGELVSEFELAQSTVSQHLKILKDAGLIRGEIVPPHVCYCLEPRGLRRLKGFVEAI
jgi:DNA-binding HxlR family transcriptional regulator